MLRTVIAKLRRAAWRTARPAASGVAGSSRVSARGGATRAWFAPLAPRRGITTVQHIPKKRRWPLVLLGLAVAGGYGYWKWLTHHNFPPTVADLLREGLWATINGAGYREPDYRKALGKYIEALQEADRLEMVPWSDEYTGIQIVIADLYERLHLYSEAASMYAEVANTYLMAIARGKIAPEDMDKIITRDLRVVLLAALLMSTDADTFKPAVELMGPHLVMATREAAKQSEELQFLLHQYPVFNVGYLRDIRNKQLPNDMFEHCWGSYRNELFAMREMMTGIATASGEYMQALMIKLKTTQIMLTSGFAAGECLLSAANIASLMFLQAVNLKFTRPDAAPGADLVGEMQNSTNSDDELPLSSDLTAEKLRAAHAEAHAKVQPRSQAGSQAEAPAEAQAEASADASAEAPTKAREAGPAAASLPPQAAVRRKQPNAQSFLHLANNVYDEIIKTVQSLDQRRTDFIPEAYVMALYGQGVIAASEGNWDRAADRLGEARLRAKGSQIESLMQTAEEQIEKVEKMRGLSREEIAQIKPSELPSVDVMFWKLSPDIEDLDRPDLPDTKF